MKKIFILILLAGTVTAGVAASAFARQAADAVRQSEIAEANLAALRDTITVYEDSLTSTVSLMQTQGAIQEVQSDSILLLLGSLNAAVIARDQTLQSLQTLQVQFDRVYDTLTSVEVRNEELLAELAEGEELAEFEIAGPPVEGSLFVTYRPNAPWGLRTNLGVTPFAMTYSVGCQANAAVVNVTTPPWVDVTPERGVVSPDVCNPVQPNTGFGGLFRIDFGKSVWMAAGGVAGWFLRGLLDSSSEPYYEPCNYTC